MFNVTLNFREIIHILNSIDTNKQEDAYNQGKITEHVL